jgi:hypothetical protein
MNKRPTASRDVVVIPSTGTRIDIPAGADDDAIDELVLSHPEVVARATRQQRRRAAGERGIPATEVYEELGLPPPEPVRRKRRQDNEAADAHKGRIVVRVPISVHDELAEKAAAEGTTINQLILHYVSRGLGADAGR